MQFYKIDKDLVDRWLGTDNDRLVWWIDMLQMAAWKETTTNKIVLQKGQFVSTVQQLCCRWKSTAKKVRNYLDWLQQTGRIARETNNLFTVFTITEISGEKQEKGKRRANEGQTKGKRRANQLYEKSDDYDTQGANEGQTKGKRRANEGQTNIRILDKLDNYNINISTTPAPARARGDDFDWVDLANAYNAIMDEAGAAIPRIKGITEKRKAAVRARAREYGRDAIEDVFRKAARSPFLNGHGNRAFVADFDWMMRPNNFPKVLEGNYDELFKTDDYATNKQDNTSGNGGYERRRQQAMELVARLVGENQGIAAGH